MRLPEIARSEGWVVVAKPSGLMVHRSRDGGAPDRVFALQLVRDQVGRHVYPVHRLDRPRSRFRLGIPVPITYTPSRRDFYPFAPLRRASGATPFLWI